MTRTLARRAFPREASSDERLLKILAELAAFARTPLRQHPAPQPLDVELTLLVSCDPRVPMPRLKVDELRHTPPRRHTQATLVALGRVQPPLLFGGFLVAQPVRARALGGPAQHLALVGTFASVRHATVIVPLSLLVPNRALRLAVTVVVLASTALGHVVGDIEGPAVAPGRQHVGIRARLACVLLFCLCVPLVLGLLALLAHEEILGGHGVCALPAYRPCRALVRLGPLRSVPLLALPSSALLGSCRPPARVSSAVRPLGGPRRTPRVPVMVRPALFAVDAASLPPFPATAMSIELLAKAPHVCGGQASVVAAGRMRLRCSDTISSTATMHRVANHFGSLLLHLLACILERGRRRVILELRKRSVRQEHLDRKLITLPRRQMERRAPVRVHGVHLDPWALQQGHDAIMALVLHCDMQRARAHMMRLIVRAWEAQDIWIGIGLEQLPAALYQVPLAHAVQQAPPIELRVQGVHRRASLLKERDQRLAVVLLDDCAGLAQQCICTVCVRLTLGNLCRVRAPRVFFIGRTLRIRTRKTLRKTLRAQGRLELMRYLLLLSQGCGQLCLARFCTTLHLLDALVPQRRARLRAAARHAAYNIVGGGCRNWHHVCLPCQRVAC